MVISSDRVIARGAVHHGVRCSKARFSSRKPSLVLNKSTLLGRAGSALACLTLLGAPACTGKLLGGSDGAPGTAPNGMAGGSTGPNGGGGGSAPVNIAELDCTNHVVDP